MNRQEVLAVANRCEMPAYPRLDIVAVRGKGARVFDANGEAYLDLYGGHAVALLGHSPAAVVEAVTLQAKDLLFYSNVLHAPSRALAAKRLCRIAPWDDAKVFFVNSGAEANETALKIARKAAGRTKVVAFEGGFHGRTLGVLAACGLGDYRAQANGIVDGYLSAVFNGPLNVIDETVAAVLVEPIQSMGGMRAMTSEFAQGLRARCEEKGALLVFDEVQTAPARTGFWFAGERWGVTPDLITTAKGVAAGFPAGVVLASGKVAATVETGDQGTTFGGGPLACAAIEATLKVLEEHDGPALARSIEARVRAGLPGAEICGYGALLGLRVQGPEAIKILREEHRVLIGGCPGDSTILRLFPPLTITDSELEEGIAALRNVIA